MNNKKKVVRVELGYIYRFSNVLHMQFHRKQFELVAATEAAKINITPDMLKEWKDAIELEVEINKQTQASAITKEMLAKDRERDEILSFFFGTIRANRYSHIESARKAALKLSVELKSYFGIQNEMNEAESGHIIGMKKDAEKYPAELAALGLIDTLNHLSVVNAEYERLERTRRTDSVASKLQSTKLARRESDTAFEAIVQCIQASYQISAIESDRQLIVRLVDEMNKVSSDFRDMYNQSMAQKKSAKKNKPGDDKKPDEPKKPDDGKKPSDPKNPDDGKKPDDGKTPKPGREEDPGEDKV